MQYSSQVLTLFTTVDFNANQFKINCAGNYGAPDDGPSDKEWFWVHDGLTDIDNFCIKTATIYQDKILAFCRGKPRNVLEQCCSFILVLKLKIEAGLVKGFEEGYSYIKLDPLINPEFLTKPFISM